jgi:phosphoribosylaminoimidazole-succinocarboxamide synthase
VYRCITPRIEWPKNRTTLKSMMLAADAVFSTDLPLPGRRQGKVRDVYTLPGRTPPALLVVATDRVSAFDVVMPTPMPGKGRLLTHVSLGWFRWLREQQLVADHVLSTDVPAECLQDEAIAASLAGRVMQCRAARVIPIECVARGYLAGSGWAEYQRHGTACGIALPTGLRQCERLPEPIFTPATKAAEGHDENISPAQAQDALERDPLWSRFGGRALAKRLERITIELYSRAANHARSRGVILADTKFEFGLALDAQGEPTDELLIVDEVLTPDSSRYWPADRYEAGRDQPSFDKQVLRNWLLDEVSAGRWNKEAPGPQLPESVLELTLERYREIARILA